MLAAVYCSSVGSGRKAARADPMQLRGHTKLPQPDRTAFAHSERVCALVQNEFAANGGAISFRRFMELVLYAPGLGYYSAGAHKFGAKGDFATAPELSNVFSRCVARQCQQVLTVTGGGILELGAGSGIMAAAVLHELERLHCLPERYLILELSADLQQRQYQTLLAKVPHLLPQVRWLKQLPSKPIKGIIVANEVLDALPIERFRITANGLRPLLVAWEGDYFVYQEGSAEPDWWPVLADRLSTTLPLGYESEYNPQLAHWLYSLAQCLWQGVMLFIDYGYPAREYYHYERSMGTLICHYRQRAHHDPFIYPGLQDISASVDFTALAEAVLGAELELLGYTSQNYFLFGCGLEEILAHAYLPDQMAYWQLSQQVKKLILPGEMGERFKVLACGRDFDKPLRGFELHDERVRL